MTRLQWSALVKVAAVAGVTPEQLTKTTIQAGQNRWWQRSADIGPTATAQRR